MSLRASPRGRTIPTPVAWANRPLDGPVYKCRHASVRTQIGATGMQEDCGPRNGNRQADITEEKAVKTRRRGEKNWESKGGK
jgi:hypothetical protein